MKVKTHSYSYTYKRPPRSNLAISNPESIFFIEYFLDTIKATQSH